jgi:hypothetical protein
MNLSSIFKQPVDRPIEGVIKADDDTGLGLEVQEYVLTNEVKKRLENFLDAYNNYEGANGVWISGFFGSGKSHLLKMLALLLENRVLDDVSVVDTFIEKAGNVFLKEQIKKAVSIPSQSILFNIDQKADVISKTEIDALLSVFVKVFDEACGYYGKQPYIAQFERDIDADGLFEDFKTAFASIASKDWNWGRMRAKRVSAQVDEAYQKVTGQKVTDILDKYRSDYKLSIEDFANQVAAYIDSKGKDFRLNFFVDEVGQYIADNTKLMTNLQTVAESLATKCRGRAWIIVTAQEDMNSVIGEMNQKQGNDFSKIQARFANRMKLTSADVAEVIQKRLLLKNEQGVEILSSIYHEQVNNLKTLFNFTDGSQQYKNYTDRDHFIHSYPFVPYQFVLFQSAIQNLSKHNAFEGEHSSVGERSMLGVFREVAIEISGQSVGKLATFDLMFEGIRTALKSQIQRAITLAEQNLDNTFAVRVLKALFLIKYVKEFKPTIRNLSVLMLEDFNQDQAALHRDLEEALNLLEQQTYIQRNGDLYEFLTDEEKDVEQEIKNTDVESSDVADELQKIIFDQIIKSKKIRFSENGQDYAYARKLDNKLYGRDHELSIHVITPLNENAANATVLRMQNMGKDELLIVMPEDDRLVRDILMYKRTEKYIRQNISITQQESIKGILTNKSYKNRERLADLQSSIKEALSKATLFVGENEIEIASLDPQLRIAKAFQSLILRAYPNLAMLRGINYTEKDVPQCMQRSQDGLFSNDAASLAESEKEILAFIQSNKRSGVRTTLKNVIEHFEAKPYGWYFAAIVCNIAHLIGRGKIELKDDSNTLEGKALERALLNTAIHPNVIIEPQIDVPASQIRTVKEIYEDFFNAPPKSSEAKELGEEVQQAFKEKLSELERIRAQQSQFPFLVSLDEVIALLKELASKPYNWYFSELEQYEDKLYTYKKNIISPILSFMHNNALKSIYLDAAKFIEKQSANFSYVDGSEVKQITDILVDTECYRDNKLHRLKSLVQTFNEKISDALEKERNSAKTEITTMGNRLKAMDEFAKLTLEQQRSYIEKFDILIEKINTQTLIAVISDMVDRFHERDYMQILSEIGSIANAKEEIDSATDNAGSDVPKSKIEYISSKSIDVTYDKAWLEDENDVNRYLEKMREALLKEIKEGKRIQV